MMPVPPLGPRLIPAMALAALVPLSAAAHAENTDDLQSLLSESVITTASTQAEKASTAPATSVTITAEELRAYGIRSIAEAVDFLSVGVVTQNALRTPDIGARGVLLPNDDGKHVLLLINGHAVNDPLLGAARFDEGAGVPFDAVDHLEVIVGPGSVLYGSNAMLGVVNVITKNANDYRGGHVFGEFEPGRTARVGAGAGIPFRLFGAPSEVTASAEYTTRFGPDLTFDEQPFPRAPVSGQLVPFRRGVPNGVFGGSMRDGYYSQAPSGLLQVRSGNLELNVMASLYRRGIPFQTQGLNVDFDDPKSYEMDRAIRVDLRHRATLSSLVQLTSRVYGDSFDYQRQVNRDADYACFRNSFQTCAYYDAGLARWAGVEERLALNWLEDQSLVTMLGVDARLRWVRAKQDAIDADTGAPFAPSAGKISDSALLLSPYVEQTWSPSRFFALNAGLRVDADARFAAIPSPRGAISLSPFEKTTIRGVYSQAFRAPTWYETDAANYHQAPAHDIKPEVVRSVEGSILQRFATQRLLFGVFRTTWENLIELAPLSVAETAVLENQGILPIDATTISQYRNVSRLLNYGWNAKWDGTLSDGKFSYGASATEAFTRRELRGVSEPLVVAPQLFGNVHLSYAFGGFVPTPALAVHYYGKRIIDRAYEGGYEAMPPAPAMAEFRGTLSGRIPGVRGLGYRLSAAYATASHGAYVAGPGTAGAFPGTTIVPTVPVDQFRVFVGLRWDFLGPDDEEAR